jgi:O-antigen/teichoic acid export membrane protein
MSGSSTFSSGVARVYATRLVQFSSTVASAFLIARLLGAEGRGIYSLLLLLPSTLFALGQLGLPSALTFFAGAGRSVRSLVVGATALAAVLSTLIVIVSLVALPAVQPVLFSAAPLDLLTIAAFALPILLVSSFFGSILWGRQRVRPYSRVLAAQSVAGLVVLIGLVGIAGLGVRGALAGYLVVSGAAAVIIVGLVLRERSRETIDTAAGESVQRPVGVGALLGYGMRLYPSAVATFLSYRVDLFLLSLLLADAGDIGRYAIAVSMAEITFQVPDSVATLFYPRVAGAERAEADRLAPSMARFTLLATSLAALALIPLAWLAIRIVLPGFEASLLPFLILLPGTVALGLGKVLSAYISGLRRPEPVSVIAVIALVVNVAVNLLLIPLFGIVGAALASLTSYCVHAILTIGLASRLSGARPAEFVLVGRAEVDGLIERISAIRPRSGTAG